MAVLSEFFISNILTFRLKIQILNLSLRYKVKQFISISANIFQKTIHNQ